MLIVANQMDQIQNHTNYYPDPTTIQMIALSLSTFIYGSAVAVGTRTFVKWLFGPLPLRRKDRKPVT